MSDTQHFGRMVREQRQSKRLSLERAAELCDLSAKALANIELGNSDPKLSSIMRIASALGMDCGSLNPCMKQFSTTDRS